jgi:hypothetical protein
MRGLVLVLLLVLSFPAAAWARAPCGLRSAVTPE